MERDEYFGVALAAVAFISGLVFGLYGFNTKVITRTLHERPTLTQVIRGKGAAAIVKALGKPDHTFAGSDVGQSLSGLSCGVWQSHGVIVCWRQ